MDLAEPDAFERMGSLLTREADLRRVRDAAAALGQSRDRKEASADAVPFLAARARDCHWPLWGRSTPPVEEMLVCGAPRVVPGRGYCAAHERIGTVKTRSRL